MGYSLKVHVGPFYLVPKQDVPVVKAIRACSNTATCGKPAANRADKFCPDCGSQIIDSRVPSTEHRYPTPDDLDGDWTDLMVVAGLPDGRQVWSPNHRGFGKNIGSNEGGGWSVFEQKTVDEELAKFRAYHKGIFSAFHAKFGTELVEAYGVIAYHS